jgi:hypothetical protein
MEIKQERAVEKGEDISDKQTEAPPRALTTKGRTELLEHLESCLFFSKTGAIIWTEVTDCHWSGECCHLLPSCKVAYSAISKQQLLS